VAEIICDDEIPFGDEIRLDGGWVDLISSAPAGFIRASLGFHCALCDFIKKRKKCSAPIIRMECINAFPTSKRHPGQGGVLFYFWP
jgi:hypothetical protein